MYEWVFSAQKERSPGWYLAAAVVAATLVIWAFFVKLYAMSVVVILFVGVYILYENNSQDVVRVRLFDDAIEVDGTRYAYSDLKEFGIVTVDDSFTLLRFMGRGITGGLLDLPIPRDIPVQDLRAFLAERVTENTDMRFGNIERLLHVFRV